MCSEDSIFYAHCRYFVKQFRACGAFKAEEKRVARAVCRFFRSPKKVCSTSCRKLPHEGMCPKCKLNQKTYGQSSSSPSSRDRPRKAGAAPQQKTQQQYAARQRVGIDALADMEAENLKRLRREQRRHMAGPPRHERPGREDRTAPPPGLHQRRRGRMDPSANTDSYLDSGLVSGAVALMSPDDFRANIPPPRLPASVVKRGGVTAGGQKAREGTKPKPPRARQDGGGRRGGSEAPRMYHIDEVLAPSPTSVVSSKPGEGLSRPVSYEEIGQFDRNSWESH